MRTAAGQCCFFALPDRDASGRSAHARVRTHEALCAGWLVLHKVTKGSLHKLIWPEAQMIQCSTQQQYIKQQRASELEATALMGIRRH